MGDPEFLEIRQELACIGEPQRGAELQPVRAAHMATLPPSSQPNGARPAMTRNSLRLAERELSSRVAGRLYMHAGHHREGVDTATGGAADPFISVPRRPPFPPYADRPLPIFPRRRAPGTVVTPTVQPSSLTLGRFREIVQPPALLAGPTRPPPTVCPARP